MIQSNGLSLVLLGWFVALAIAEAATARRRRADLWVIGSDERLVTNFGLTTLVLIAGAILPMTSAAAAASVHVGLADRIPIPWIVILALMLTGQTFGAYWAHRWMHRNPLLWRIHRVHHADSAVDVSTSLRNHPLELLVTVPVSVLVTVAIGAPISAVIASQTIIVAATIWEHADILLPSEVERALTAIIVAPRLHRLHHSVDRAIHDSNFGTVFTTWDRLFGTFCDINGRQRVGLDHQLARADSLLDQIRSPLLRSQARENRSLKS